MTLRMPITRVRSAASASQGRGATRVVCVDSVMGLSYRICGAVEFGAVIEVGVGAAMGRFWGHGMQYLHYRYLFKGMLGEHAYRGAFPVGGAHPHIHTLGSDSL